MAEERRKVEGDGWSDVVRSALGPRQLSRDSPEVNNAGLYWTSIISYYSFDSISCTLFRCFLENNGHAQ